MDPLKWSWEESQHIHHTLFTAYQKNEALSPTELDTLYGLMRILRDRPDEKGSFVFSSSYLEKKFPRSAFHDYFRFYRSYSNLSGEYQINLNDPAVSNFYNQATDLKFLNKTLINELDTITNPNDNKLALRINKDRKAAIKNQSKLYREFIIGFRRLKYKELEINCYALDTLYYIESMFYKSGTLMVKKIHGVEFQVSAESIAHILFTHYGPDMYDGKKELKSHFNMDVQPFRLIRMIMTFISSLELRSEPLDLSNFPKLDLTYMTRVYRLRFKKTGQNKIELTTFHPIQNTTALAFFEENSNPINHPEIPRILLH